MDEPTRPAPLRPHRDRLSEADPNFPFIMEAHDAAVAAGRGGYLDPSTGLFVMTAEFHVSRGRCCHNGCRHCPYVGAEEGA